MYYWRFKGQFWPRGGQIVPPVLPETIFKGGKDGAKGINNLHAYERK